MSGARASPDVRIGDRGFVAQALAAHVLAEAGRALAEQGTFTIALPGGSVASQCFPRLAALALDWSRIEFFWVDERAVPPTSPESNYAAARNLWLEPARVPGERVHRMPGEADDLERAAREYAGELQGIAGTPPRLDCVLLGVGPDGHVASLFPGHPALLDGRPVLAIEDAPKPPPRRLSLSLPVLAGAARVAIVAFGEEKAEVIREALEDARSMLPVARVVRSARRCALLLDRAAASGIRGDSGPAGS
ncbi:MAG: 6-phosphogluconolactonase [Candidatus Eiseniibacteriota bacterium]